MASHTQLGQFN